MAKESLAEFLTRQKLLLPSRDGFALTALEEGDKREVARFTMTVEAEEIESIWRENECPPCVVFAFEKSGNIVGDYSLVRTGKNAFGKQNREAREKAFEGVNFHRMFETFTKGFEKLQSGHERLFEESLKDREELSRTNARLLKQGVKGYEFADSVLETKSKLARAEGDYDIRLAEIEKSNMKWREGLNLIGKLAPLVAGKFLLPSGGGKPSTAPSTPAPGAPPITIVEVDPVAGDARELARDLTDEQIKKLLHFVMNLPADTLEAMVACLGEEFSGKVQNFVVKHLGKI